MGQDFYRVIDGYNFPFNVLAMNIVQRNGTLTATAPDGPGRIERIYMRTSDLDPSTFLDNVMIITIDTVAIFNTSLIHMIGLAGIAAWDGVWGGRYTGPLCSGMQVLLNLDYRSSASIGVQNTTSPDPTNFRVSFWGRRGI